MFVQTGRAINFGTLSVKSPPSTNHGLACDALISALLRLAPSPLSSAVHMLYMQHAATCCLRKRMCRLLTPCHCLQLPIMSQIESPIQIAGPGRQLDADFQDATVDVEEAQSACTTPEPVHPEDAPADEDEATDEAAPAKKKAAARKKKEKQPRGAPKKKKSEKAKRAPSAFNIFMKQELQRLKIEDAELSHKERFKRAANNWSKLTAEDKSAFAPQATA